MSDLYLGLMSGTSLDGIDAVVVDFSQQSPQLVAKHYSAFTPELRQTILALCQPGLDEINRLGELDVILGQQFAQAVLALLKKNNLSAKQIRAIGSHGQTIRHHPHRTYPFSLQIGDPNVIAAETGITTVADFRRRDVALGGQGAPLVPAFHQSIFAAQNKDRVVLNIGGIANLTLLKMQTEAPLGFDIGPGNTLLDAWANKHLNLLHDNKGAWGRSGSMDTTLFEQLFLDDFFRLAPPKSTGREYFNLEWLQKNLNRLGTMPKPADVQNTLVELTAQSIKCSIENLLKSGEIFVCGGGIHNDFLMERLKALLPHFTIQSTQMLGIDPDWVEAIAFAWLAKQTMEGRPGNIPAVTGAKKSSVLGGIYI